MRNFSDIESPTPDRVIVRILDQHAAAIAVLREEIRHVRLIQVAHASHRGKHKKRRAVLRERAVGE